jgi:hypothetical protein
MSKGRAFIPVVFAVGFGVANGMFCPITWFVTCAKRYKLSGLSVQHSRSKLKSGRRKLGLLLYILCDIEQCWYIFRKLEEGDKPLDKEVTASIKAAADASRSEATAEALQSKSNVWQTAAKFWDKPSNVSSPTNEISQTITKGQKPDESSK